MTPRIVARAREHARAVAVIDASGEHSFERLLGTSERVASGLLGDRTDLHEDRVAFLVEAGFDYVAVQWGIWRAGGIAVPLPLGFTDSELQDYVADSRPGVVVASETNIDLAQRLTLGGEARVVGLDDLFGAAPGALPDVAAERRAMILYTSGTTSRPKGVVTTHANITAQVEVLVSTWGWTGTDRTLLVLPLHHVHGIVNVLGCALWSGATCEVLGKFDAGAVWDRLASGSLTVFMAVPTVYARLVDAWRRFDGPRQDAVGRALRCLRLMVSGSAALPVPLFEAWRDLSGHALLERYGMTEIGMALSNPLDGPRIPGTVGHPLPTVDVRLVDEEGRPVPEGAPGEIEVRGPSVFLEYWGRPDDTVHAFRDGWFRTGDIAIVESGRYRILGRASVDIIKTRGHKVSALEIEDVIRAHGAVADCAVVGVSDPVLGERICAAIVLSDGTSLDLAELRTWARARLASFKLPGDARFVDALPRNALGKVTKKAVAELFGVPS